MENVKEYSVQKFCVININNQKNQSGRLPRQSFVAGQNQTEHAIKLAGSERLPKGTPFGRQRTPSFGFAGPKPKRSSGNVGARQGGA